MYMYVHIICIRIPCTFPDFSFAPRTNSHVSLSNLPFFAAAATPLRSLAPSKLRCFRANGRGNFKTGLTGCTWLWPMVMTDI